MPRTIPEGTIDVWVARPPFDAAPELEARYAALLAPDEAERAARFRFDVHRREYLLTRALARATLSEYRDVAPRAWRFVRNAYGRPSTDPPCGLEWNLSNTPSLVVCAVSDGRELGVDVEPLERAPDILEVAETVFSPRERDALAKLDAPSARDRAVTLWTAKEAYMKARGMGMSLPPLAITIGFDGAATPTIEVAGAMDDGRAWSVRTCDVQGHRVAVCVQAAREEALRLAVRETVPRPDEGS